jgi:AcrR family transcriptional regulator
MATLTRQQHKDRTRSLLMATARRHFAREGVGQARTADIAASARVAHGTLFVHFPTREDLVAAVVEDFGKRVAGRIHELADEGLGVKDLLTAHLNGLQEFEPLYSRLVTEGPALPRGVQDAMTSIQSAISHHLSRAAEREMKEGRIRRMPYHLFFTTWIGLVHYYIAHASSFAPGESVLKRHGQMLRDHFLMLVKEDRS